ncbi:hypothetical protein SDC9_148426 [bioreactor metagenome]|uniref:Uncharacterized protein n=1 Tax=bioreactor metagenome TaxID=1076179 RepID=A0A645EIR3_9ZZZZ
MTVGNVVEQLPGGVAVLGYRIIELQSLFEPALGVKGACTIPLFIFFLRQARLIRKNKGK